jgi:hypothetical protein
MPKGKPIEGWQLMSATIIPALMTNFPQTVVFSFSANLKIDDIRVLPFDANMKSFVYDHSSDRLMAQLDENHYASFYEYDREGQLIRVKKETEKGIVTVSENRKSLHKHF